MANILRTSLALALLLLITGASLAVAETVTNSGILSGLSSFASHAWSRLPESGALLIWGTGLAAASRAMSRKRSDSTK